MDRRARAVEQMHKVVRLRELGVPLWVIKDVQVRMVCWRRGMRGGVGHNRLANELRERHVLPLMGD